MDRKSFWGEIKNEENIPQITRAMIELRTPKPYELEQTECAVNFKKEASERNVLFQITCPQTIHCIRLQMYIQKLKDFVNALENISPHAQQFTSMDEIIALKQEIPERPILGNSELQDNGIGRNAQSINPENLHVLARKSIASVAAYSGFVETDDSTLNVLADVTKTFIESFVNSLRDVLDNEALSGSTTFYDAMDSVCNTSANTNLPKLLKWWKEEYLAKIDSLENVANSLEERLRKLKENKKNIGHKTQNNFNIKKDNFHSEAFSGNYGTWTTVESASASSSQFQSAFPYQNQVNVKTEDPNTLYYPTG